MESLSQIAKRFLSRAQRDAAYWEAVPEAVALFHFIYTEDVWVADYNDRIQSVRSKKIEDLNADEIRVYLTAVIAKERNWSAYSRCIVDGTVDRLLTRYLKLTQTDGSDQHAPRT